MKYFIAVAILAMLLASQNAFAGDETTSNDSQSLVQSGLSLAKQKCARCHSVGKEDTSTHAEAPPFREVVTRYPAEHLAEALAEGIVSGHPDMPVFTFTPDEIDAFLAYLDSLGQHASPQEK